MLFFGNILKLFQGFYKNAAGIPEVCNRMLYPSSYSKLSGLIDVVHYFSEIYGETINKLFDGYQSMIDTLRDPNYYGNGEMAASRSWLWQTCNLIACPIKKRILYSKLVHRIVFISNLAFPSTVFVTRGKKQISFFLITTKAVKSTL